MDLISNTNDISGYDGYIELYFGAKWNYLSTIRAFIQNYIDIIINDSKLAGKIAMAASELIENAIKYSSRTDIPLQFKLVILKTTEKKLYFEVRNYADSDNIDILKNEYKQMMRNNPYESYLKKVKEVANRSDGKVGLGLTRVRYETNCELNIKTNEKLVIVHANFKL